MLLVYAATGLLRGLQDTRTPLAVAVAGFAANILLNYLFIYVAGLGIAGSALGTVAAQWAMVLVYAVIVARHARRVGAPLLPHHAGIGRTARAGGWLFLRTASLRAAMLLAVFAATQQGPDELAAFQVTMTVFATLAFALDALAIAAQALIGKGLGEGDLGRRPRGAAPVHPVGHRRGRRCWAWCTIALSPFAAALFTSDASVAALLPLSLAIVGVGAPLGGYVFVLDGVLIGAGDARYLALTGLLNVAVFVPLAVAAASVGRPRRRRARRAHRRVRVRVPRRPGGHPGAAGARPGVDARGRDGLTGRAPRACVGDCRATAPVQASSLLRRPPIARPPDSRSQSRASHASHSRAATTSARTPVSIVGCGTGAKNGEWFDGMSVSTVPAAIAVSTVSGSAPPSIQ